MADGWKIVVFVIISLPTSLGDGLAPVNLTAEYIANGSIRVTWCDHPDTKIHQYFVNILDIRHFYLPNDTHQYVLARTTPNTVYTIKVSSTSITSVLGTSETSITTPTAMYRPVDGAAEFSLPLPSVGYVILKVSKRQVLSFYYGKLSQTPIPGLSVYVNDTVTLTFNRLTTRDAGYYYIERNLEPMTPGHLLVVTDAPATPLITSSNQSPNLDSFVTLNCQSESQSKPINHGLEMTYSWTLNGSRSDSSRFVVNGSNLMI
ncbi:uncharacterized protein [Argopecten irradians]|uniref:uncharacterized protein n=1 Tax=Argopecten irradians TaxID=31199 RepID=UPI00371DDF23